MADESVRLGAERDLDALAGTHEHEPRRVGRIAETGLGDEAGGGPRVVGLLLDVEGELEVLSLAPVANECEHADHVAARKPCRLAQTVQPPAPPQKGPVRPAAVDDDPVQALATQLAVPGTRDESLRIRLQRDVVDVRQSPDRDPVAGQRYALGGPSGPWGERQPGRGRHASHTR